MFGGSFNLIDVHSYRFTGQKLSWDSHDTTTLNPEPQTLNVEKPDYYTTLPWLAKISGAVLFMGTDVGIKGV